MRHILWCKSCKKYTMKQICGCGNKTEPKKPPKYSPEDKYAKYRRKAKEEVWKEEGMV